MSVNTATKIPAITQIRGLPPLAVMALQAIKETLEVREGLHEPLDRFVSVRELAELILDDEDIVNYLGSGHSHDDRYYTKSQWDLDAKGDLNVAQGLDVPGTLSVGIDNQLIRAKAAASLGIEYFSLLGTSNQVVVTHNASDATLSLPQNIHSGASPTFTALTLSNIVAGVADYDKFLVSDAGVLKYRTGAEVLSDIGAAGSGHTHALNDLSDVDCSGPTDGDVLTYQSGSGKWEDIAPSGGGGATDYAFRTITGITNDVVAELAHDTLTLATANNLLSIVGTTATDTITFTVNQGNLDHGSIGGLDHSADHAWALLVDGTRPLTADWNIGNSKLGINTVPSYPLHIVQAPGDENARTIFLDINSSGIQTLGRNHYGLFVDINSTLDQNGNYSSIHGVRVDLSADAGSDISELYGLYSLTTHNSVNTASVVYGAYNCATISNGSANNVYGLRNSVNINLSGAVSTAYGLYNSVQMDVAGNTLVAAYGGNSQITQTAGTITTGYLYYGGYTGTIGTKWGIYLDGETKSYFSGQVGIKESSPAADLDIAGTLILLNGTSINEFSTDGTLAGNSDDAVPTEKAVKTYVDASGGVSDKISEGDSNVEVIDTGTGQIDFDVDATRRAMLNASGLQLGETGPRIASFVDEDNMVSDSAVRAPTQQSVKKYVDDNTGRSYVKVSDVKTSGTQGGDFNSGAWQTRTLNTEDSDPDSVCTLSSNQITLAAGTYECHISAPAIQVGYHKAKLRNVTDSADIILGTVEYSTATGGQGDRSFVVGRFTIAASKAIEVQHYCQTTKLTWGFGSSVNLGGSDEVYTVAEFWKVG